MANHKSAIKRNKQNAKLRDHNRLIRSSLRTTIKKTRAAVEAKDKEAAVKLFQAAEVSIQKAASKNILHKNNASRKISRLAAQVNAL